MAAGLYDYPRLLSCLQKAQFDGFISVEDFGSLPGEERFGDAIEYLRSVEG